MPHNNLRAAPHTDLHCLLSLDVSDRLYTVKPLPAGAYEIEASRFARELFEYYEYCVVNDPTKLDEIRAWTATILAAPGPQRSRYHSSLLLVASGMLPASGLPASSHAARR